MGATATLSNPMATGLLATFSWLGSAIAISFSTDANKRRIFFESAVPFSDTADLSGHNAKYFSAAFRAKLSIQLLQYQISSHGLLLHLNEAACHYSLAKQQSILFPNHLSSICSSPRPRAYLFACC